jgi:WD40 repeat protein
MRHSRTFRIFVSSTFADLVEERNALQRQVFPVLAKICEKAGCRFQAIDLRWGVTVEAGLDQRTARICLEEIQRCQTITPRPNFIILLGNRYGWCPLPEAISAGEFEQINRYAQDHQLEHRSLLTAWYSRDDNADPPVYFLRRRKEEDDADYTQLDVWAKQVELPLRELLASAAGTIPLTDEHRVEYERSLTEREILKGALNDTVPDAEGHVFAYFRDVDHLDQLESTSTEEYDLLRRYVDFVDAATAEGCHLRDLDARAKLRDLRMRIENRLGGGHTHHYPATWCSQGVSSDHVDRLCADVLADLRTVIEAEIHRLTASDPLKDEVTFHQEFGKDLGSKERFRGRRTLLQRIGEYVTSTDAKRPLVVHGPAGTGKTALMARAAELAEEQRPGSVVVRRFIGATPWSADGRALLQVLCQELGNRYDSDSALPLEHREMIAEFRHRLAWATPAKPLIMFLDALDQLSETDNVQALAWIPVQLPPNVCLVVSVLDDPPSSPPNTPPGAIRPGDPLAVLRRRIPAESFVPMDDLSAITGSHLLDDWLQADRGNRRTLQLEQRAAVLRAFERCPRPLFLKLAAQEAKLWRSSLPATLPDRSTADEMLDAVIQQLFDRLSQPANHSPLLVERAVGYLAAARHGLTEEELLAVLSSDEEFFQSFKARTEDVGQSLATEVDELPVAVWARLYCDLQPYLVETRLDDLRLLKFFHGRIQQRALAAFTNQEKHRRLADFFLGRARSRDRHALREVTTQLIRSSDFAGSVSFLCNLENVEARVGVGQTLTLLGDIQEAIASHPECVNERHRSDTRMRALGQWAASLIEAAQTERLAQLSEELVPSPVATTQNVSPAPAESPEASLVMSQLIHWSRFVSGNLKRFTEVDRLPQVVIQAALEYRGAEDLSAQALRALRHSSATFFLMNSPYDGTPATEKDDFLLASEDLPVGSLCLSMDGRFVFYGTRLDPKRETPDSLARAVVLDALSGLQVAEISVNHPGVSALAAAATGEMLFIAEFARRLHIWKWESSRLHTLRLDHHEPVTSLAVTPDGLFLASGHTDGSIVIWHVAPHLHFRALARFQPHDGPIASIALRRDGLWVAAAYTAGKMVCIDLKHGQAEEFGGYSIASQLRNVFANALEESLRQMNLDISPGTKTYGPLSVSLSPDGTRLLVGDTEDNVDVYDCTKDKPMQVSHLSPPVTKTHFEETMTYHGAKAVAFSGMGSEMAVLYGAGCLAAFDFQSGAESYFLAAHSFGGTAVAPAPDNAFVVTAGEDGLVKRWSVPRKEGLPAFPHGDRISEIQLVDDLMITCGYDRIIRIWDAPSRREIGRLVGHKHWITSFALCLDSNVCVSVGQEGVLRKWNLQERRQEFLLHGWNARINAVRLCQDGRIAVTADDRGVILGVTVDDGEPVFEWVGHEGYALDVRILASETRVVTGGQEGRLTVRDLGTNDVVWTVDAHSDWVTKVCTNDELGIVASGARDGTIAARRASDGILLFEQRGHKERVNGLAIDEPRGLLLSAGGDCVVKAWSLLTGSLVASCVQDHPITALSNVRANGEVATGSAFGEITIWKIVTSGAVPQNAKPHHCDQAENGGQPDRSDR